ncbi:MAG: GH3 family domain-containing protein [Candidatus Thorarchaeota archaeon]
MTIMRKLISRVAQKKVKEIDYLLTHSWEATQDKLMEIIKKNKETVYGRKFDFDSISSAEKYMNRVPLTDACRLRPYLEMVYQDPRGQILTKDSVVWYLQTSGTTGKPKRMPITKRGVKDVAKGTMMTWMAFIAEDEENAKIVDGSLITFGAAAVLDHINGVPVGYATGTYGRFMNPLFKKLMKPGEDIFNISDMDEKMRTYAELMVKEDVTGLQGITTLSLALVRRMQNDYGPWLLERFRGTSYEDKLKRVIDDEGHIDVAQLWPNLRLFLATGIDSGPYKKWISETFPLVHIREIYGASEGVFAGQLLGEGKGIQIFPNINFIEFIPENEIDEVEPETVPITDVKKGYTYELVITNAQGYYRYRMGDVVTIVDTDPISIKGISRRGNVVNLSGEKITAAHITTAITAACLKTDAEIMDYTVYGTVENGIGHYEILAMFRNGDQVKTDEFVAAFEESMKAINEEFRVVRETGALDPTIIKSIDTSIYDRIVTQRHHQSKPAPLTTSNDVRDLLEL